MAKPQRYLCPHCRKPFALGVRGAPLVITAACPLCGAGGAKIRHDPRSPMGARATYTPPLHKLEGERSA